MVPVGSLEGDRNHSSVTMFVLLGISDDKELQLSLFSVFLGIYLVTLFWNLGLIILIRMDSHLHTPMYFFLSCLSFIDICFTSSTSPRMLSDFFKDKKTMSFIACATQWFFCSWMGQAELCLLAAMAYDKYMAVGKPLQYSSIMVHGLCLKLASGPLVYGFLGVLVETVPCFGMYFCGPINVIQHFFCNITEIISLSCSNPFITQMSLFLIVSLVDVGSLPTILSSYGFIATSILKISSGKGSAKAFNTCASHLAIVTLFYGTSLAVYMNPRSGHPTKQNKFLSVFYIIIIPMLNPLIHSLRNKEIKDALKRMRKRITHLPH